jgi:hypothetical protein
MEAVYMNCKKATSSEFLDVFFHSATTGFCSKMYRSPNNMLYSTGIFDSVFISHRQYPENTRKTVPVNQRVCQRSVT